MATLNFTNASISFKDAGLKGAKSVNPTALDFAKSGEPVLFVAQQDGAVWRYVVEKGSGGFAVSKAGTPSQKGAAAIEIDAVQKGVDNYTDDGKAGPAGVRQVTGLAVAQETIGGVKRDVLYVTSSDHQIGGGASGVSYNIDSNSSQIHKVVIDQKTGAVIDSVALVRGLPRSPENHSANGVEIATDPDTGDTLLYLAQGAHTNKGAPSNNMVGSIDPALAGSIVKFNLTQMSKYDVRTDGAGERFVIDLPTLNDPKRADVDLSKLGIQNLSADPHFALDNNGKGSNGALLPDWAGGAAGYNQAKITSHVLVSEGGQLKLVASPMTVIQPGHRNPYDVLVTKAGEVVTWDNGPNGGWGGEPRSFQDGKNVDDWMADLAVNDFNEGGSQGFQDQLHIVGLVGEDQGPYAGFPNPIRAAKAVLDRAFATDGSYRGKTAGSPILDDDGTVIFRSEDEARDYLARLLPVYEKVGGTWTNVQPADSDGDPILPEDLHDIVSGYGWAHPGSSIADPLKHFKGTPIASGTVFSPESQNLAFGKDGSLILGSGSTNGLAQYTAGSWFGGALEDALLATGFGGGKLLFTKLVDTNGDGRTDKAVALGSIADFGALPLAVAALGDKGLGTFIDEDGDKIDDFSGVIFAATYGANAITTFTPGGTPAKPSTDQDLDGLSDTKDTHVGDALDGRSVMAGTAPMRWHFVLSDPTATPAGAVSTSGPAGGIGLTAAWANGKLAGVSGGLYDDQNFDLGGASTFASSEEADTGTPDGTANSLRDVIGVGATLSRSLASATVTTEMVNVFDYGLNKDQGKTWDGGEEVGLVIGPDQSDFVRAVIAVRSDGVVGLRLTAESADARIGASFKAMPGVDAPAVIPNQSSSIQLGFVLDLTEGAETVTARARYQNPDRDDKIGADAPWSEWFETASVALPKAVLASLYGEHAHLGAQTGTVIGLYSRAKPGDDSFAASWDWVEIDGTARKGGAEEVIYRWNAGAAGDTVRSLDDGPDWISTKAAIATGSKKVGQFNIAGRDESLPDYVPQAVFAKENWDGPAGSELSLKFGQKFLGEPLEDGLYAVRVFLGNGYSRTSQVGQRLFDVTVEGQALAEDFDPIFAWGHDTGGMLEWIGRIDDGAVDIGFLRGVENPQVNAVEIVKIDTSKASATAPAVSVQSPKLPEGIGKTNVTIQTDLPVPTGEMVTVFYEVRPVSGGAAPWADYKIPGATLASGVYAGSAVIPGGASTTSIPVTIVQDSKVEGDETFQVAITAVSGGDARIGTGRATITIADDDAASGEAPSTGTPSGMPSSSGGSRRPDDKARGVDASDFSDKAEAPTAIRLKPGSNTITATQDGAPLDEDFVTFTVPTGYELSAMRLKGFDVYGTKTGNTVFLGLAAGEDYPVDVATPGEGSGKLLGGVVYGASELGMNLLGEMADGVIDGAGGAPTKGFSGPLKPGTYTLGWSQDKGATTSMINLKLDATASTTTTAAEASTSLVGSAEMLITPTGGIQVSNYGRNAFRFTNTGDKAITGVKIDVADALYPDSVFDPFGRAGDTVSKKLTIDSEGGTGVKAPTSASYIGKGGTDGYEAIQIAFDPNASGGFRKGESLGFSIDMDPNSVAGSQKATLDAGTYPAWDVGGVSGAELIGSTITVTFADGTKATGQLHGTGTQSGAQALASQAGKATPVTLKANGFEAGEVGTYGDGGPKVTIQGEAGATARVVLTKGFIQPVENEFSGAYKSQLDRQLAALRAEDFPANNAVEFQTIDVKLTGKVQDISSKFDFDSVAGVALGSEDDLALGLVAGVVNGSGKPVSKVSAPIYLGHDDEAPSGGGGTPPTDPVETHRIAVWADGEAFKTSSGSLVKPKYDLYVDGEKVATRTVTTADAKPFDRDFDKFVFHFEGPAPDSVGIRFTNDKSRKPYGPGDDVNLFVDRIKVDTFEFQAEKDGYVTADNRAAAERLGWDGPREDMLGNGLMLFDDLGLA